MLFVYSSAVPLVIITLVTVAKPNKGKKWHQLHVSILGLLIALMFTSFFTDLVKVSRDNQNRRHSTYKPTQVRYLGIRS